MRITITIDEGGAACAKGFKKVIVECYDCKYDDKPLYNKLKMEWRPLAKSWVMEFFQNADVNYILNYVERKLSVLGTYDKLIIDNVTEEIEINEKEMEMLLAI